MGNPAAASTSPPAVIVHHDAAQRTVLATWLAAAGLASHGYATATEALTSLAPDRPPALVVTALELPGIDGWRFCRLLRSTACLAEARVPILAVAESFADPEIRRPPA